MNVMWFSCGVSSFISAYLERENLDKIIYCHIDDQHPDSLRFLKECEEKIGLKIEILQSNYKNVENVCSAFNMIKVRGATKCTDILKMRPRKQWEYDNKDKDITYIWGFDKNEQIRADKLLDAMPKFKHKFPLIERGLSKADCHGILKTLDIKRPIMYDLGYPNNNCIGCIKGGIGYWNKIRKDFPDIFEKRSKMEREIGFSILAEETKINGKRTKTPLFLDELEETRGRFEDEIPQECSIMCQLNL